MKAFNFSLLIIFLSAAAQSALLYTPTTLKPETAQMVVVIHGCLQSAESMALGTGWNQIADKNNLVILYPQVPDGSNALGCWSWFSPEHQRADRGQLKKIMDEIQSTQKLLGLKSSSKLYVTGISSGSAMAAGLISCFPNEFAAAALHSGPGYGLAQNVFDGDRVLREGPPDKRPETACDPKKFAGKVLVIQGEQDPKVNPKHAGQLVKDYSGDGRALTPKTFKDGEFTFVVTDYWESKGLKLRLVMIQELDHSWSGFIKNLRYASLLQPKFPTQIPFFNEKGPSSTNLAWDFFSP